MAKATPASGQESSACTDCSAWTPHSRSVSGWKPTDSSQRRSSVGDVTGQPAREHAMKAMVQHDYGALQDAGIFPGARPSSAWSAQCRPSAR